MLFQNYADLTLTDVIVDATNMQSGAYALSNNNGKVTIDGSSGILPAETSEQENPATVDGIFIAFGGTYNYDVSSLKRCEV